MVVGWAGCGLGRGWRGGRGEEVSWVLGGGGWMMGVVAWGGVGGGLVCRGGAVLGEGAVGAGGGWGDAGEGGWVFAVGRWGFVPGQRWEWAQGRGAVRRWRGGGLRGGAGGGGVGRHRNPHMREGGNCEGEGFLSSTDCSVSNRRDGIP